jgi:hypothetical protein
MNGFRRMPSNSSSRQVFQTVPPRTAPTLADVRDAIEATSTLRRSERNEYFYSLGIDYDRVCQYHDTVCALERCLQTQQDNHETILVELREHFRAFAAAFSLLWHIATKP